MPVQALSSLADTGMKERVFGSHFMGALNGYAEKSHEMLSQVFAI